MLTTMCLGRLWPGLVLAGACLVLHLPSDAGANRAHAPAPRRLPASRLVFAATVASPTQIYSIEPSGRHPAQLTFAPEGASAPLPSPDGRYVAFARGGSIWVMRADGRGQRLLAARGIEPAWTPDSRRIAYVSGRRGARLGIRVVGADGKGDRMLVRGGTASPAWSPDGRSLAFGRGGSLVVLRDGRQRTVLTRPEPSPGYGVARIAWSLDRRLIAFLDRVYEGQLVPGTSPLSGTLEVVRVDGRWERDLAQDVVAGPAWSPKSTLLAYAGLGLSRGVSVIDPLTGHVRTSAGASDVNSIAWSPRGDAVAFGSWAVFPEILGATSELDVLTLAGRIRRLAPFPEPEGVAWTRPPAGLRYRSPQPLGPLVSSNELKLRAPVQELAADGDRVAYRYCATIGVWGVGDSKALSIQADRPPCAEDFLSFYGLALSGDRVAWGVLSGGSVKEDSLLVTSVGAVAFRLVTEGDPRGDARAGYLLGAGPLLVFSTWDYCYRPGSGCPNVPIEQQPVSSQMLWRVREPSWPELCPGTNARCQQLRVEPGPLQPLDVGQGRIVASGDNATVVLDADGRQLLSLPVPTKAAELAGSDLVVVVPGELRDYDATTGALLHAWPLPYVSFGGFCGVPPENCGYAQFRLEDAARGLVAYVVGGPRPVGAAGGQIHLLRLADGRDVVLNAGTAARFGASGLFYAYQATGAWPGRIRFVPFDQLPLRRCAG